MKKTALITGGSGGIGLALAFELGKRGYTTYISGRDKDKLEKALLQLQNQGISCKGFSGDVSSEKESLAMIESCVKEFGQLNVLINNAGISMRTNFEETPLEYFKQVIYTNFMGAVFCTKFALPYLQKSKGSIVNISSVAGHRGLPGRTAYSASKAALNLFSESLRTEILDKGVHILNVSPGFIATDIRKQAISSQGTGQKAKDESKMMSAETAAKKIIDALEKRKRDLVLTKLGKATIFLNKWFPSFMDKQTIKKMKEV